MNEFEKQVLAMMQELKTEINGIKTRIEGLCNAQEETNRHLEQVDQRLDGLDKRMDDLDKRMDDLDKRMDGLDKRMDDLTQEVRANHAAAMEGFDTMVAEIGDKQMRDGKRLNETVEVVSRLCYDVEVLKRKVG